MKNLKNHENIQKGTLHNSLMSSVHWLEAGQDYYIEREYTDNEKRQVTPDELVRWFNLRTFGVTNPGPDDSSIRPLAG